MKVLILCGGRGTRLREETEYRPKPMVPIGPHPILWHIMKIYSHFGHRDFVLCLGYKGGMIKEYFRNFLWHQGDVTVRPGSDHPPTFHTTPGDSWTVTLAETGEDSMTAWRIRQAARYLGDDEDFLLTYGDGVADVDLDAVLAFHRSHNKTVTLTGVHPPGRFGELHLAADGTAQSFNEKPQAEGGYINGGFMVCRTKPFLARLPADPTVMLENEPMRRLAADGELAVFKHEGFWQPMDTQPEFLLLNRLWAEGRAPWRCWA
jgi:glucose-1-phosphate cytidylyltransferase